MTLKEFLSNSLYNQTEIAVNLYPNEKIVNVRTKFLSKLKNINYNKFSLEEKKKIIAFLKSEFEKINFINDLE